MKKAIFFPILIIGFVSIQQPSGIEIIKKVDNNLLSVNKFVISKMIIHGRRATRSVTAKSWIKGEEKSFTEYIDPPRERGTKMLKIQDNLWMYSPATDRIIRISGNMLRQSVLGSDLTYEDLMEDPKISTHYIPFVTGSDTVLGTDAWIVRLDAKDETVAYKKRIIWVDKEKYIVLKDERYGKSGRLLKSVIIKKVEKKSGRWVATHIIFKDALKSGKGTEFIIKEVRFNVKIPSYRFSKASLKR